MTSEIQLNVMFVKAVRRWPLILGMGLMGAALGFVFSMIFQPHYEAKATLAVNIQYGVTEPLELVVEDRALNRVAAILQSDVVLKRALETMEESILVERGWMEPADFWKSVRLDRRLAEWDLVAIDPDPIVAANLAHAWSEAALLVLDEASEHSWRALGLMAENPLEIGCVPSSDSESDAEIIEWVCCIQLEDLDPGIISEELRKEITLSRGMLPNISYELIRQAQQPTAPVIWARGSLVLSGGLIGLVFGLWWVLIRRD
jgi:hypothetical protein